MRDGWRLGWRVSAFVLVVGLLGTSVVGAKDDSGHPFTQILAKLDQILAKMNSGGTGAANYAQRWDQNLPAGSRFTVLAAFQNQAVLDNNTGLVWEQSPALSTGDFQDSTYACANKNIGGTKGWRLPAAPELGSLVDPSVATPGPTLPPGHPFTNVQSQVYWSATSHAITPTTAWTMNFTSGDFNSDNRMNGRHLAWCVRGSMNTNMY